MSSGLTGIFNYRVAGRRVSDQLFTLRTVGVFILRHLIRGNAYLNFKYRRHSVFVLAIRDVLLVLTFRYRFVFVHFQKVSSIYFQKRRQRNLSFAPSASLYFWVLNIRRNDRLSHCQRYFHVIFLQVRGLQFCAITASKLYYRLI